jgi:hypothetical protein
MGGIEMFHPGKIDHDMNFPDQLAERQNYERGGNISQDRGKAGT